MTLKESCYKWKWNLFISLLDYVSIIFYLLYAGHGSPHSVCACLLNLDIVEKFSLSLWVLQMWNRSSERQGKLDQSHPPGKWRICNLSSSETDLIVCTSPVCRSFKCVIISKQWNKQLYVLVFCFYYCFSSFSPKGMSDFW